MTSSCEMMVTALRSESKPTPSRETSFTTMASSDFDDNFLRAFSRMFSVSAAKPTTICDFLCRANSAENVRRRLEFQHHRPLALDFLHGCRLGRKSATAAVMTTTVLAGRSLKTAARISSAVSTGVSSAAPGGVIEVEPLTSSTPAPRRSAASASAYPMRPLDRFVR